MKSQEYNLYSIMCWKGFCHPSLTVFEGVTENLIIIQKVLASSKKHKTGMNFYMKTYCHCQKSKFSKHTMYQVLNTKVCFLNSVQKWERMEKAKLRVFFYQWRTTYWPSNLTCSDKGLLIPTESIISYPKGYFCGPYGKKGCLFR